MRCKEAQDRVFIASRQRFAQSNLTPRFNGLFLAPGALLLQEAICSSTLIPRNANYLVHSVVQLRLFKVVIAQGVIVIQLTYVFFIVSQVLVEYVHRVVAIYSWLTVTGGCRGNFVGGTPEVSCAPVFSPKAAVEGVSITISTYWGCSG